jgi:hypothetical protein
MLVSLDFNVPIFHPDRIGACIAMLFQYPGNVFHCCRIMLQAADNGYTLSFSSFRVQRDTNSFAFTTVLMFSRSVGLPMQFRSPQELL